MSDITVILPKNGPSVRRQLMQALKTTRPGDSFIVESNSIRQNALGLARKLGFKVASRMLSDTGVYAPDARFLITRHY